VHRAALVLTVALPLAAADLVWKHLATTPAWAYHPRGLAWLGLSLGLVGAALLAARLRSLGSVVAAGVMAGGVLGNAISAAWNNLRVPDPIIVMPGRDAVIAFNLADVFTTIGILTLTAGLAGAIVRHRHLLPTRDEMRPRR
jgi:lipoprotein signal peptidase